MPHATADLEPMAPGIRRIFEVGGTIAAINTLRAATGIFPARSILRTLQFAIGATLTYAVNAHLRIATGLVATPQSTDFDTGARILPNVSPAVALGAYRADPAGDANDLLVNFTLPDQNARILFEIANNNSVQIFYRLRFIIDGIIRLGD